MTVILQTGFSSSASPILTHARILHSGAWLSGGTAVASSTATDYDADAPLNTLTYEAWKPTSGTATWEYAHTGSASTMGAGIAAHTLGDAGASVQFQYYDGAAWQALTPVTAITSNEPIMGLWAAQSATRWRVSITVGSAPEIGVVKFGTPLAMERPLYGGHSPIDLSRQTILRSNYSETGQFLGRSKQRTYFATDYSWSNLTAAWVRTNWPTLQDGIEAEPFWLAWRPASFGAVGFCQVDEVPVPQNMGVRDLMSVGMSVRALGHD